MSLATSPHICFAFFLSEVSEPLSQTTTNFTRAVPGNGHQKSRLISQTVLGMCWFCPSPWIKFVIRFTLVNEKKEKHKLKFANHGNSGIVLPITANHGSRDWWRMITVGGYGGPITYVTMNTYLYDYHSCTQPPTLTGKFHFMICWARASCKCDFL